MWLCMKILFPDLTGECPPSPRIMIETPLKYPLMDYWVTGESKYVKEFTDLLPEGHLCREIMEL